MSNPCLARRQIVRHGTLHMPRVFPEFLELHHSGDGRLYICRSRTLCNAKNDSNDGKGLSCCRLACLTCGCRWILFESAWCTSSSLSVICLFNCYVHLGMDAPSSPFVPPIIISLDTVWDLSFLKTIKSVPWFVNLKPEQFAIPAAPSLVKVALLSPPRSSSATSLSVMMAAC